MDSRLNALRYWMPSSRYQSGASRTATMSQPPPVSVCWHTVCNIPTGRADRANSEVFVWGYPIGKRHDHNKTTLCRFHTLVPHHGNDAALPSKNPGASFGVSDAKDITEKHPNVDQEGADLQALNEAQWESIVCAQMWRLFFLGGSTSVSTASSLEIT